MFVYRKYIKEIFNIVNFRDFEKLALQAFYYQLENNSVYKEYCSLLNKNIENVSRITEIPFIPASLYKNRKIVSKVSEDYTVFSSSATTGSIPSLHYVSDIGLYKTSFINNFHLFYGNPKDYVIIALLPSYLERNGSSLVYMANELIRLSRKKQSGFFLNQFEEIHSLITSLEENGNKYLLLGVSFALLDFAETCKLKINNGIVMETGGMKGRKAEITRAELHSQLIKAFGCESVHSEYGMTELLSQAYSKNDGLFVCPPQMKVLVRDTTDPLSISITGKGALNIIDLANINSCCFLETGDLGQVNKDGSFEVAGRFDVAEIRGCSLLVS